MDNRPSDELIKRWKTFDSTNTEVVQPIANTWSINNNLSSFRIDPLQDPDSTDMGCLFAPRLGTGSNQRTGQQVFMHRVLVSGRIGTPGGTIPVLSIEPYTNPLEVRILLVLDRRGSGILLDPAYIFVSSPTGLGVIPALCSYTTPDLDPSTIEILDEVNLVLPPIIPVPTVTTPSPLVGTLKNFEVFAADFPLNSTTTGTQALVAGTGGPIALATTIDALQPPLTIGQLPFGASSADIEFDAIEVPTSHFLISSRSEKFELAYEFPEPIRCNFRSPGVGDVTDCVDNAIYLIAACDSGNQCTVTLMSRVFFSD